jgi:hypothetical protein
MTDFEELLEDFEELVEEVSQFGITHPYHTDSDLEKSYKEARKAILSYVKTLKEKGND